MYNVIWYVGEVHHLDGRVTKYRLQSALEPETEIKSRRLLDDEDPDGYLESDKDWVINNLEACVGFLETVEKFTPKKDRSEQP